MTAKNSEKTKAPPRPATSHVQNPQKKKKNAKTNSASNTPVESGENIQKDKANQENAPAALPPNKKLPVGSLQLQFAGELILVRNPNRALASVFRRYEALFEALANMERVERLLNYKFLAGLMLTSHARKTTDREQKRKLFDLKNALFLNVANDRESRRKVMFRYLLSKHFRVSEYCADCKKSNTDSATERHKWKYCDKCTVDRNFYNILSMQHRFANGSATLFLSNDQIPKIQHLQMQHKGNLDEAEEEAIFQKYHYNTRNLDAFAVESVIKAQERLLKL